MGNSLGYTIFRADAFIFVITYALELGAFSLARILFQKVITKKFIRNRLLISKNQEFFLVFCEPNEIMGLINSAT